MNIVLGTTSPQKVNILKTTLEGKLAYWSIRGVEADSGVSDLPLSIEEITQGATNLAKAAFAQQPNAGLAVGMESGLENIGGIYNLICAVAFWDGQKLIVGQSGHLPLPKPVSDKFKAGGNLNELIREYQEIATPSEQERIKQIITQELSYISAINDALPKIRKWVGQGQLATVLAYFISGHGQALLLRLSAICFGIFFVLKAVIAFTSPLLIQMKILQPWFNYEAYYAGLNIMFVLGLCCWLYGLRQLASLTSLQKDRSLIRHIHISSFLGLPFLIILVFAVMLSIFRVLLNDDFIELTAWSDILLILVGLAQLGIVIPTWLLLGRMVELKSISGFTQVILLAGLACLLIIEWLILLQFDSPHPYFLLLYSIGLSWTYGVMRLSSEIGEFGQPRPLVDIAKSFDKA